MSDITITLPEDHLAKLQKKAADLGVTLEALVLLSIDDLLSKPEDEFAQAAAYILEKNKELYRRLA